MKVYIDGTLYDEKEAKISVFDHGLLYGDGIFEGIRFYNGRVFQLAEHLVRLEKSARAIGLKLPLEREEIRSALLETIRANGLREGYVRLVVTRGRGTLGLDPYRCPVASIIIIASTITLYPEETYQNGLKLVTCATRRPTPASLSPAVKSLNYLNNVMAKMEAIHAGAQEGLMLNEQGYVAECTGDNLFIATEGRVVTPPVTAGGLDGITRRVAMNILEEQGVEVCEKNLTRYEIYTADECFLTGTAAEVVPAVVLDDRAIGDGKPGPITLECMKRFHEFTQNSGEPID